MSQFSYKYYRHNYSRNDDTSMQNRDDGRWTYWRSWGIFEYLVSLLLLGMFFLLLSFFLRSGMFPSAAISNHLPVSVPVTSVQPNVPSQKSTPVAHEATSTKIKTETSDYVYTKKVLPKSLLPTVQTAANGTVIYGPISIDEYLYFVRETGFTYPDFIDASTSRLIVSKKPECYAMDCPIVDVSTLNRKFYATWLGTMLGKNLVLASDGREITLRESNCTP